MVNGVLKALGPVGDVLDWVLTQAASAADQLYREAVLAIRYVKKSVDEVLDWAAAKTAAVFEAIVKAIEAAGIALHRGVPVGRRRGRRRARAARRGDAAAEELDQLRAHVDRDGRDRRAPGGRQGPAQGGRRGRGPDRLGRHPVGPDREGGHRGAARGRHHDRSSSSSTRSGTRSTPSTTSPRHCASSARPSARSSSPPSSSPLAMPQKQGDPVAEGHRRGPARRARRA